MAKAPEGSDAWALTKPLTQLFLVLVAEERLRYEKGDLLSMGSSGGGAQGRHGKPDIETMFRPGDLIFEEVVQVEEASDLAVPMTLGYLSEAEQGHDDLMNHLFGTRYQP